MTKPILNNPIKLASIFHTKRCHTMSYQSFGATNIANAVTTVDCQKQVRSWRLLRSLIQLLIPTCNCTFIEQEQEHEHERQPTKIKSFPNYYSNYYNPKPIFTTTSTTTITGTIFGFRRGKVSFCIQTNSKSTNPILLLEFAVPTTILAREMKGGILRIALECSSTNLNWDSHSTNYSVLSMPLWTMYCNGRKAGYALKRRPSKIDREALRLMGSVVVGTGIISGKELHKEDDELMYLRANFARVSGGSFQAESFHLIDPDGSIGQELSIFFFRSK